MPRTRGSGTRGATGQGQSARVLWIEPDGTVDKVMCARDDGGGVCRPALADRKDVPLRSPCVRRGIVRMELDGLIKSVACHHEAMAIEAMERRHH